MPISWHSRAGTTVLSKLGRESLAELNLGNRPSALCKQNSGIFQSILGRLLSCTSDQNAKLEAMVPKARRDGPCVLSQPAEDMAQFLGLKHLASLFLFSSLLPHLLCFLTRHQRGTALTTGSNLVPPIAPFQEEEIQAEMC